jgi:DNA-binding HxlR family transcriptional regulator
MTKAEKSAVAEGEGCGPCGVPEELGAVFCLLQEKWVLSIVYVLMRGPIGFNEVGRGAGWVNAATLAQRLAKLEKAGLVTKTVQSTMPPRTSYALTEAGQALRPVIEAMAAWGERHGGAVRACTGKETDRR